METNAKLCLFRKYVLIITLSFVLIIPVLAQNVNNQPNIHIEVKRELDDKGNVIRYDSTYSWTWSSSDSIVNLLNDSTFFQFTQKFDLFLKNPFSIPDNDSTFFDFFDFSDNPFDFNQQIEQIIKRQEEILERHYAIIEQLQKLNPITPKPNISEQDHLPSTKKETLKEKSQQQVIDL